MDSLNTQKGSTESTLKTAMLFAHWLPNICRIVGIGLIFLAAASYMTNMTLLDLLNYVEQIFSFTFILLFTPLVLCGSYALIILNRHSADRAQKIFWFEVGQQSANGISTLALTFTLLGISVGIGTLSQQSLTPESVNEVIGVLTKQFSMAFMTTVVGLPTATLCRALLSICMVRPQKQYQNYISLNQTYEEQHHDFNS